MTAAHRACSRLEGKQTNKPISSQQKKYTNSLGLYRKIMASLSYKQIKHHSKKDLFYILGVCVCVSIHIGAGATGATRQC